MKVLTFVSSLNLNSGGPSRSVPMLVKGLAEVGVDITLMTIRSENMNTHAIEDTSAKLHILEPGFSYYELSSFLNTENFDLIQIQSVWELHYHKLIQLARKLRIPYIITPRGMLEPWSLSQKRWKKKLALMLYQMRDLNNSACIFTTSELEARHVRQLGVKVPISIIPNGIETEGYVCRTSIEGVKKQVLFLSRIHEKKGIELLIDSWASLIKDFPTWKLLIVGNGEEEYINSLKNRVGENKLHDFIQILPPAFGEDKYKLYCESSLFVLPTYSENFGMVIAEAMSCGVPVITTTNTPWELLNGKRNAMGVNPTDRTGWCIELSRYNLESTLREAMNMDPEELYQMGQKASRLIEENFNYQSVARKTKILYDWIMNNGEPPYFLFD